MAAPLHAIKDEAARLFALPPAKLFVGSAHPEIVFAEAAAVYAAWVCRTSFDGMFKVTVERIDELRRICAGERVRDRRYNAIAGDLVWFALHRYDAERVRQRSAAA